MYPAIAPRASWQQLSPSGSCVRCCCGIFKTTLRPPETTSRYKFTLSVQSAALEAESGSFFMRKARFRSAIGIARV